VKEEDIGKGARYRWKIFIILALAYFFVYFHRLSISVVADDLARDFQTTASMLGVLGSIYFYCYALMQLPAGLLSDSIGPRKTVTYFLLIASVGSILFGLAPTIHVAFIGRIMVGLGVSMVFIPTMKILSRWFRAREFARMAGVLNAVGGLGVLGATWALAAAANALGWRFSFELIGLCTFLIVGLVWSVVRDRPQDKGWPPIAEDRALPLPSVIRMSLWEGLRRVISEKYFWPLALWFFFDCGVFFGFGALWGGPYLMHVYGMTRADAGSVLAMIAWAMILGSPLLGYISDNMAKSRKKPLILSSAVLVAVLAFLNSYPSGLPRTALFVVFFVFSLCASAIVVVGFTSAKELFPIEIAGTSVGAVNLFPFLGGAVFMPLLGRVLDAYPGSMSGQYSIEGYRTLLFVLLVASIGSLVCAFFIKETFPN